MEKWSAWDIIMLVVIIIGAINWGLIGFFRYDLIAAIFGVATVVSRIIFAIVGLAGLWAITFLFRRHGRTT